MFDAENVWPIATVGEVADILDSRRIPLNSEERRTRRGPYPYWGANGVVDHIDAFLFDEPLVLMAEDGGYFADAATKPICHLLDGQVWVNNHAHVIRPIKVDRDFFYYWFVHRDITSFIKGGTRTKLNQADLKKLPIAVPPPDEQQRITEVLRSVDAAIQANSNALQQMERARHALLFDAFETGSWEPVRLAELGSWQSGGTPSKEEARYWGGDIPWICPRDMKVPIISSSSDTITRAALGGASKLVPKGTLLLVVRGMILARTVPTAITGVEASFNQDIKAFRPNGRARPDFVRLCIQHQEHALLKVVNTATHGTKKLDTNTIQDILIPLPNNDEQLSFVEAVNGLDESISNYRSQHVRLKYIGQSLRSDLLSGRVRVPA